jgi:hypothetical protein
MGSFAGADFRQMEPASANLSRQRHVPGDQKDEPVLVRDFRQALRQRRANIRVGMAQDYRGAGGESERRL